MSVSRLEPGTGSLRTLLNVGDLGPGEERWPANEIYRLEDFAQLRTVVSELRSWTVTLDDPQADAQEAALLRSLGKAHSLGAPVVVDGALWGEFYATRRAEQVRFGARDTAYTEALVAILAGAVSRALHVESLERLAFVDPLTGLANQRALDEAAARAFDVIADRSARRVSIVAFDVNGLKRVNDTAGHAEGDRLLTSVAALLVDHFSALHGSLVARVGGDEFSVLVPGHEPDVVVASATAVCEAAARLTVGSGVSAGVATTTADGRLASVSRLFRAADDAQYQAKRGQHLTACWPRLASSDAGPQGLRKSIAGVLSKV